MPEGGQGKGQHGPVYWRSLADDGYLPEELKRRVYAGSNIAKWAKEHKEELAEVSFVLSNHCFNHCFTEAIRIDEQNEAQSQNPAGQAALPGPSRLDRMQQYVDRGRRADGSAGLTPVSR